MKNKLVVLLLLIFSAKSVLYATSDGTVYNNQTQLGSISYSDIIALGVFEYSWNNISVPYVVSASGGAFYWDDSSWIRITNNSFGNILYAASGADLTLYLATSQNILYQYSNQNRSWVNSMSFSQNIVGLAADQVGNIYIGVQNSSNQVMVYNLSSNGLAFVPMQTMNGTLTALNIDPSQRLLAGIIVNNIPSLYRLENQTWIDLGGINDYWYDNTNVTTIIVSPNGTIAFMDNNTCYVWLVFNDSNSIGQMVETPVNTPLLSLAFDNNGTLWGGAVRGYIYYNQDYTSGSNGAWFQYYDPYSISNEPSILAIACTQYQVLEVTANITAVILIAVCLIVFIIVICVCVICVCTRKNNLAISQQAVEMTPTVNQVNYSIFLIF